MSQLLRGLILIGVMLLIWQSIVTGGHLPAYILPSPCAVIQTLYTQSSLLLQESIPTIVETFLGLGLGILFGSLTALIMAFFRPAARWLLPILVVTQAIPTFALAPLLVLWFGYGIASKIITTIVMIFFPVTSAFFDGLKRTDQSWLDLAKTMQAKQWRIFWFIRIPSALPYLASGIRVAAVIAPIGAVVGEWVGASQGLGYLMLHANARMQIDLMFAALFIIILFSLFLYGIVNQLLQYFIPWEIEKEHHLS